jgi:hypothetical protein
MVARQGFKRALGISTALPAKHSAMQRRRVGAISLDGMGGGGYRRSHHPAVPNAEPVPIRETVMNSRLLLSTLALALQLSVAAAHADGPWSATLYAGPATNRIFSQIVTDGKFDANSAMVGLSLDRQLIYFGSGVSIFGEAQVTEYMLGQSDTTADLGLGLGFTHFPWSRYFPMSLRFSTGPSYATNPPLYYGGYLGHRKALLNYVGIEWAVPIPHAQGWDGALRIFHRSGAWGLYTKDVDEGTTIGIGIRRRF